MRRAVIDVGTNSTLLLIGEMNEHKHVQDILQRFNVTRLGEGVNKTGVIHKKSMERTLEVLSSYDDEINRFGNCQIHILGTQALRIAKNAAEFKKLLKRRFNWDLEILSEEQEAKYSYIGACDVINNITQNIIVIDIGGGSTEVIIGKEDRILKHQSLSIGAVTLAEKLFMKDILTIDDRIKLYDHIVHIFKKLTFFDKIENGMLLFGVGGTITTLAAIMQKMVQYQSEQINGFQLTKDNINEVYNDLNKLTLADRRKVPGLVRGREDVILFGILILLVYMELYRFNKIIVSDRGLRFGYLKWIEMHR